MPESRKEPCELHVFLVCFLCSEFLGDSYGIPYFLSPSGPLKRLHRSNTNGQAATRGKLIRRCQEKEREINTDIEGAHPSPHRDEETLNSWRGVAASLPSKTRKKSLRKGPDMADKAAGRGANHWSPIATSAPGPKRGRQRRSPRPPLPSQRALPRRRTTMPFKPLRPCAELLKSSGR